MYISNYKTSSTKTLQAPDTINTKNSYSDTCAYPACMILDYMCKLKSFCVTPLEAYAIETDRVAVPIVCAKEGE